MFSDFLGVTVGKAHFATYVPSGAGKAIHKNRPYHGFVLNDSAVERKYYFESGEILHTKGDTLFYLPKGSSYRVERIDGSDQGCYAINFECDIEIEVPPFMLTPRAVQGIRQSFRAADRVWNTQNKAAFTIAQRSICEIILAGHEEEKRAYVPDSRAIQIAPAMEYIHSHFFENEIRISEAAALCGMSEVYFRRIFRTLHGKSPTDYIIDMRMERASRLLFDGGFSVREVAELCGYYEETHFSREFKKRMGISPASYK